MEGIHEMAHQCPYCDTDLSFTIDGDGKQVEMALWDVAVCGTCAQLIQLVGNGLVRFTDAALRLMRSIDPELADDLETAQRLIRQFDRRSC